ncbi:MAG: AAA family ATPase [Actinomycetota bacterium]
MKPLRMQVRNLGQIAQADIDFGDLTVLVGPQATGKSLLLQSLKLGLDPRAVRATIRENGYKIGSWPEFVDFYFGEGMNSLWTDDTFVKVGSTEVGPRVLNLRRIEDAVHELVYVPAQRTLAVPTGFPRNFRDFGLDTPFVVRRYGSVLNDDLLNETYVQDADRLFPNTGRLRARIREALDESVFHGAKLVLTEVGPRQELRLELPDGSTLPMMAWTAGQREFVPLLLGLYRLLPAGSISKHQDTDWIVIEEPEMGLHPQAILAVMVLVTNLVARGYRVVLSTHHPLVLDVVWTIGRIRDSGVDRPSAALCRALLGRIDPGLEQDCARILDKDLRVAALNYDKSQHVFSTDISSLDPSDADETISGWGGLTGVSDQLMAAVSEVSA